jgi:hypothetical protein
MQAMGSFFLMLNSLKVFLALLVHGFCPVKSSMIFMALSRGSPDLPIEEFTTTLTILGFSIGLLYCFLLASADPTLLSPLAWHGYF